jgi:hypothetical protein
MSIYFKISGLKSNSSFVLKDLVFASFAMEIEMRETREITFYMFDSLAPTNCVYLLISFQCSANMHCELQIFAKNVSLRTVFSLMAVVESKSGCPLRLATRELDDIGRETSFSLMFVHPSK